ncbi:hypothetical protein V8D89_002916 [Ganoderma adspersum]
MERPAATLFGVSVEGYDVELWMPMVVNQTAWFQGLVAAISRTIQDDEKNAVAEAIDAEQAEMSAKDEKALIKVLKKWKAGELKMPEVFEELSKKNGYTAIGEFRFPHPVATGGLTMAAEWKTWFIANFEKLNSKLDLTPNVDGTPAGGARTPGSTASSAGDSSAPRGSPQRRGAKVGNLNTRPIRTRVRSRAGALPARVTPEDLRAMAQYLFEKGDDGDMRRYNSLRWREFAERPENHKRSLDAWACIPRLHPRHAAAIERYLKEYQAEAEAV